MAGKLHKAYFLYANGNGNRLAPGDRRARAYAEGYRAWAGGGNTRLNNPFPAWQQSDPDNSDWGAWDSGWNDNDQGFPPTHVGNGYPQGPDLDPEPGLTVSRTGNIVPKKKKKKGKHK